MNPWLDAAAVRLGEYAVARGQGRVAALGLGSCVAVILYDSEARVGALAHVVLPSTASAKTETNPTKFAESAVPFLIREMERSGADGRRVVARLVGGARMFSALLPAGAVHMGERNVAACRAALAAVGVTTAAEDTGREYGRSVVLDVTNGQVTVRSVGHGTKHV